MCKIIGKFQKIGAESSFSKILIFKNNMGSRFRIKCKHHISYGKDLETVNFRKNKKKIELNLGMNCLERISLLSKLV